METNHGVHILIATDLLPPGLYNEMKLVLNTSSFEKIAKSSI